MRHILIVFLLTSAIGTAASMVMIAPAQSGLVTTFDASRITVNMGADNIDGHAVLYMKGHYRVTDATPLSKFCLTLDLKKLSAAQRFENMSFYNLIWYTPACSEVEGTSPCLPDGAVTFINEQWCDL